eukprot:159078-Amphidinium_carterae.2
MRATPMRTSGKKRQVNPRQCATAAWFVSSRPVNKLPLSVALDSVQIQGRTTVSNPMARRTSWRRLDKPKRRLLALTGSDLEPTCYETTHFHELRKILFWTVLVPSGTQILLKPKVAMASTGSQERRRHRPHRYPPVIGGGKRFPESLLSFFSAVRCESYGKEAALEPLTA